MEKIYDFLNDLKHRFSNPLFSAFIIAWLITNWRVVIVLCFYSPSDMNFYKLGTYLDFIYNNVPLSKGLFWPLCYAIGYVLIAPLIRLAITGFNTLINTRSDNINLKLSKSLYIPVEKFIEQQSKLRKLTTDLRDTLDEQREYQLKNAELESKIISLKKEVEDVSKEKQRYIDNMSSDALYGKWHISVHDNGPLRDARLMFKGLRVFKLVDVFDQEVPLGTIKQYISNGESAFISIVLDSDQSIENIVITRNEINGKGLEGHNLKGSEVKMRRID